MLITFPQAAAERQRRKEEKLAAAAGNDPEKTPTPKDINVDENGGQGFDGIMSLRPAPIPQNKGIKDVTKEGVSAIPVFPGPSTLRDVVQKADVVLHVVDARDPTAGMSDALSEAAQGKLTVLLNKAGVYDIWAVFSCSLGVADTVPRESLVRWLVHLRTLYTVLPFRVSSAFMPSGTPFQAPNQKAKPMPKDDALGLGGLWTYLNNLARTKDREELVVAVTGVTNVSVDPQSRSKCWLIKDQAGKSAVINSILASEVFLIYNTHMAASAKAPSTTTGAQEVVATMPGNAARRVRFIDTPGLQFVRAASLTDEEREGMRTRDVLLRCRGRIDRLKDPLSGGKWRGTDVGCALTVRIVTHIVRHADRQDLMLAYGVPAFLDVTGFLAGLARVSGLIKKVGKMRLDVWMRHAYGTTEGRAGSCRSSADCSARLVHRKVDAVQHAGGPRWRGDGRGCSGVERGEEQEGAAECSRGEAGEDGGGCERRARCRVGCGVGGGRGERGRRRRGTSGPAAGGEAQGRVCSRN